MEYLGMNKNSLSKAIGLTNNVTIGRIINEEREPSFEILKKIIQTFGSVNATWLLTGEGKMILDTHQESITNKNLVPSKEGIPLLPIEAFAGLGTELIDGYNFNQIEDRYDVPLFKGTHIDFMIAVKGSSMYPKYASGDVVACRLIKEILFIQWNKVYVIESLSQGTIIKRLKPSKKEGFVFCKSDNPEYESFEIPLIDIRNLALVVGVIRLE